MLSINATLAAAMAAGAGIPIVRAKIYFHEGSDKTLMKTVTVLYYKMDGHSLTVTCSTTIATNGSDTYIVIERGVMVGGVEYTVDSPGYYVEDASEFQNSVTYQCTAFPADLENQILLNHTFSTVQNDDTVNAVIDEVLITIMESTSIWLSMGEPGRFLRWGIDTNNVTFDYLAPHSFIETLERRFLLMAYPRRDGILFASLGGYRSIASTAYTEPDFKTRIMLPIVTPTLYWTDEADVEHSTAPGVMAAHDLGIQHSDNTSTELRNLVLPSSPTTIASLPYQYSQRPDLALEQGEFINNSIIELIEEFDTNKPFAWSQQVIPIIPHPAFFAPQATAKPAQTPEPTPPPAPTYPAPPKKRVPRRKPSWPTDPRRTADAKMLDTSRFGTILGAKNNSVQSALEKIDRHEHSGVVVDTIPGTLALTGDITPSAISSNQNDYNPTGLSTATVLRLSASGANRSITGLAGGADGRIIIIYNVGSTYNIVLLDEDAGSSAANRFDTGGYGIAIVPSAAVVLQYDSTSTRWRAMNVTAASLQGAAITTELLAGLDDGDILFWDAESGFFDSMAFPSSGTPTDGWIADSATWTRTGNHTFTVSGDVTATFRKGLKIRYKDGGSNEYGVVGSSSHAGGTTTVNLIPNSDYAMAAATITDKYYSAIENPEGFPTSFNWTITWTNLTVGNGTLTAKWAAQHGKITGHIELEFGTTSSISGTVSLSMPVNPSGYQVNFREPIGLAVFFDTSAPLGYVGQTILATSSTMGPRAINASATHATQGGVTATVPMTWATGDQLLVSFDYMF